MYPRGRNSQLGHKICLSANSSILYWDQYFVLNNLSKAILTIFLHDYFIAFKRHWRFLHSLLIVKTEKANNIFKYYWICRALITQGNYLASNHNNLLNWFWRTSAAFSEAYFPDHKTLFIDPCWLPDSSFALLLLHLKACRQYRNSFSLIYKRCLY